MIEQPKVRWMRLRVWRRNELLAFSLCLPGSARVVVVGRSGVRERKWGKRGRDELKQSQRVDMKRE